MITIPSSRSNGRALRLVTSLALLGLWLPMVAFGSAWAQNQLTARLEVEGRARVGHPLRVALTLANARNIGGYEALVTYDDQALHFSGLQQRGAGLDVAGRQLYTLGPVVLQDGVTFGAVTCDIASCHPSDDPSQARGAEGNVRLATLTVVPHTAGALKLELDSLKVVDTQGTLVQVALPSTVATSVIAAEEPESDALLEDDDAARGPASSDAGVVAGTAVDPDLTSDGRVNAGDVAEGTLAWSDSRERGELCGASLAGTVDVVPDGCLDVADLQRVAALAVSHTTSPAALPGVQATWVVNSTEDGGGNCSIRDCTLREAIGAANLSPEPDLITFAIPGPGPHTIQLTRSLTALSSGGTTIDGYSQPGAQRNTDPNASNARIMIHIRGLGPINSQDHPGVDGLRITSPDNRIDGLAFSNLRRSVVVTTGAQRNVIVGSFIGVDPAGVTTYTQGIPDVAADGAFGISVDNGATDTRIGGTTPAERNIVSGNAREGISIQDEGTDGTNVFNTIVGLSPSGAQRARNWGDGIDTGNGVQDTVIGGVDAGQRNVVSGNQGEGIEISHLAITSGNTVAGNFIGTDSTGQRNNPAEFGNRGYGIASEDGASNNVYGPGNVIASNGKGGIYFSGAPLATGNQVIENRIGVDITAAPAGNGSVGATDPSTDLGNGILLRFGAQSTLIRGNVIANNIRAGVMITGRESDFNRIIRNSFYGNGGLAIDIDPVLQWNGVAPCTNAAEQQCVGAPAITGISGRVVSGQACAGCTIEVYQADGGDIHGEGRTFLAEGVAGPDGKFVLTLPGVGVVRPLTATATDPAGNTSEFSRNSHFEVYLPFVVRNP